MILRFAYAASGKEGGEPPFHAHCTNDLEAGRSDKCLKPTELSRDFFKNLNLRDERLGLVHLERNWAGWLI